MSKILSNEQYLSTSPCSKSGPSQILPFLYLGCQDDALSVETMRNNQITHVINASKTGERASFLNENDDEHFLRIPINDCHNAQLLPYFDKVYKFIEKARDNNGRVFIHCLAGISRSPALAIAYVMRDLCLTADEAYQYVKQCRPKISPNFNFLGQLSEYERTISLTPKTTMNTIRPIVKCCTLEPPMSERRYFVPLETSSNTDTSIEQRTTGLLRPTCFNFDSISASRPKTSFSSSLSSSSSSSSSSLPSSSSSTMTKLLLQSSPEQSLVTRKVSRPNNISIKHSTFSHECSTSKLVKNNCDVLTNNKQNETVLMTPDTSLLTEQAHLINTYFQDSTILSKPPNEWKPFPSPDSTSETTTDHVSSPAHGLLVSYYDYYSPNLKN
ncbi:unnamed protein product [Rotaria socialis]|uniref:protein-tyrosine-phosphatase n=1 Tax=Rotaria socialis TaxID=392032 RepID=A0A821DKP3_9BILA|nr:unnamed protein product [Rotaria socialis]CAF4622716.1 unnamed protein product [Rotaria socialis]